MRRPARILVDQRPRPRSRAPLYVVRAADPPPLELPRSAAQPFTRAQAVSAWVACLLLIILAVAIARAALAFDAF